jgi:5-methyltetrahydropteroyltriglutamate--homocysteine methyltransferase
LNLFGLARPARRNYWKTAKVIRAKNWRTQQAAGIDLVPASDFSLYDRMLDTSVLVGAVPERFHWSGNNVDLKTYFAMARGAGKADDCGSNHATTALEMTKWFDTNYHYLVPEVHEGQGFQLSSTKPFDNLRKHWRWEFKPCR